MSSSPYNKTRHQHQSGRNKGLGDIFENKLAELFALPEMDVVDRARTEEIRDFCADSLCRMFFQLRERNFPRVLSLVSAVQQNADQDGCITEERLQEVAPAECSALLSYESILTKASVDLSATWYKVNEGIKGYAMLVKRFSLYSGYKLALLDEVVGELK
jgi:hypothetical protein